MVAIVEKENAEEAPVTEENLAEETTQDVSNAIVEDLEKTVKKKEVKSDDVVAKSFSGQKLEKKSSSDERELDGHAHNDDESDDEFDQDDLLAPDAPALAPEESYSEMLTAEYTVVDPEKNNVEGSSGDGFGREERGSMMAVSNNTNHDPQDSTDEETKSKSRVKEFLSERPVQIGILVLFVIVILTVVLGVVLSRPKDDPKTPEPTPSPTTATPTGLTDLFNVSMSMILFVNQPQVDLFAVSDVVEEHLASSLSTLPGFVQIELVLSQAAANRKLMRKLQSTLLTYDGTTYFENKVTTDQVAVALVAGVCALLNDNVGTAFSQAQLDVGTSTYDLFPGSSCSEPQDDPSPTATPVADGTASPTDAPVFVYTTQSPTEVTQSAFPSVELQKPPDTDYITLSMLFGDSPESVGWEVHLVDNDVWMSVASFPVGSFSHRRFRQRPDIFFLPFPDGLGQKFVLTLIDESPTHTGYLQYSMSFLSVSIAPPPCNFVDLLGENMTSIPFYRLLLRIDAIGCIDDLPLEEAVPQNPPYMVFTIIFAEQPEGVGVLVEEVTSSTDEAVVLYDRSVGSFGAYSPGGLGVNQTNLTVYLPSEVGGDIDKHIFLTIVDDVTKGSCCDGCVCETGYSGFQLSYVMDQGAGPTFGMEFEPGASPVRYDGTFSITSDGIVQPFALTPSPTATPVGPYITIRIKMDRFPEEVSWILSERFLSGTPVAIGASPVYEGQFGTVTDYAILDPSNTESRDFTFNLLDERGDGILDGSYTLAYTDENDIETVIYTSNTAYQFVETVDFTISRGGEVPNVASYRDTFFLQADIFFGGYPENVSWVFAEINQIGTQFTVLDSAPVGTYTTASYQNQLTVLRIPYSVGLGGQYFAFVVSDATEIVNADACLPDCTGGVIGVSLTLGVEQPCFFVKDLLVGFENQARFSFFMDQNGDTTCNGDEVEDLPEGLLQT